MIFAVFSIVIAIWGYFFYAPKWESYVGSAINQQADVTEMSDYDVAPLSCLRGFWAQLGIISTIEVLIFAVIGIICGPLQVLWCALGMVIFGAVTNYICGMYSLKNNGKFINCLIAEKYGSIADALSSLLLLVCLLYGTVVLYSFFEEINKVSYGLTILNFAAILVVPYIAVCNYRKFIYLCIGTGVIFAVMTIAYMILAFYNAQNVNIFIKLSEFKDVKNFYPMLFVASSSCVMGGILAVKSNIIVPFIKDEKYGKSIFFGSPIFLSCLTLMWAIIIYICMPNFDDYNYKIHHTLNFYSIYTDYISKSFGPFGVTLLNMLSLWLCIFEASVLLRCCGAVCKNLNAFKSAPSAKVVTLFLYAVTVVMYIISLKLTIYMFMKLLVVAYVFFVCGLYFGRGSKYSAYFKYSNCFIIGLILSYMMQIFTAMPKINTVIFGVTVTITLAALYGLYKRKHK